MGKHYRVRTIDRVAAMQFRKNRVACEAAELGILNISAFAKLIKPDVELFMRKKVSVSAISQAIRRCLDPFYL